MCGRIADLERPIAGLGQHFTVPHDDRANWHFAACRSGFRFLKRERHEIAT
jgi:hypothetical protein